MHSTLPAIKRKKAFAASNRSEKEMQTSKYAGDSASDESVSRPNPDANSGEKPQPPQGVRVKLGSGIMDELMDKAYVSVYDPFRELIANS